MQKANFNKMIRFVSVAVVACFGVVVEANLVVNGDFENNSAPGTLYNLSNASFNGYMSNATGFGDAQEIDIVQGSDYGPAPVSGLWKVNVHRQVNGATDAFSMDLSSAILGSGTYGLSFYAAYFGEPGAIDIGISSSATSFGTLIHTVQPTSAFVQYTHSFSGVSGSFLTFQPSSGYINLDDVRLDPTGVPAVPEPFTMGLAALGLGVALKRRRR